MKEKDLIAAIVRRLSPRVHSQSMTPASLNFNGTPDRYFDSDVPGGQDLWIEFKQLKAMPRSKIVIGEYTPPQLRWLARRGANAWGLVGLPNKTVVIQCTHEERVVGTPIHFAVPFDIAADIINKHILLGALQ